jgi:hypothetical protein
MIDCHAIRGVLDLAQVLNNSVEDALAEAVILVEGRLLGGAPVDEGFLDAFEWHELPSVIREELRFPEALHSRLWNTVELPFVDRRQPGLPAVETILFLH